MVKIFKSKKILKLLYKISLIQKPPPHPTNAADSSSLQSIPSLANATQEKQLHEAKHSVKTDALLMKKSLDKLELLTGMKHASDMLNKLSNIARINNTEVLLSLSPKNYYDLCKLFCI